MGAGAPSGCGPQVAEEIDPCAQRPPSVRHAGVHRPPRGAEARRGGPAAGQDIDEYLEKIEELVERSHGSCPG